MPDPTFTLRPTQTRRARTLVADAFSDQVDAGHLQAVEAVVSELLGAAFEAGVHIPVHLSVETFRLLTSLRLRCPPDVELRDDPFRLRSHILTRLTLACGRRHNADGTADLWAEVPRPITSGER